MGSLLRYEILRTFRRAYHASLQKSARNAEGVEYKSKLGAVKSKYFADDKIFKKLSDHDKPSHLGIGFFIPFLALCKTSNLTSVWTSDFYHFFRNLSIFIKLLFFCWKFYIL